MAVVSGYLYADSEGGVTAGDLQFLATGWLLRSGHVVESTGDLYTIETYNNPNSFILNRFAGEDFGYDASGKLIGGTVTGWEDFLKVTIPGGVVGPDYTEEYKLFSVTELSVPATTFASWIDTGYVVTAPILLGGDDSITGNALNGVIWAYAGNDTIAEGDKDFWHGELRGGEGNDLIGGGAGADDINGNQGNDTVHGGAGDDMVHGGRDNDSLNGNVGSDNVYGDLGDDTLRGGQGDDGLSGGGGDDWLSGDLGNDTLTGGAGADVFHSFSGAGMDRVTDFTASESDRVVLDPGTTYTVSQVGADTVVDMGPGDQLILAGVQLSGLNSGWITSS